MHVEDVVITSLSADPGNVRRHSEAQIEKLMGALRRWGQTLPLLADRNNVVRIGNARLEAARRIGWERVKVVYLDLSPSEWVSLAVADNKLHDDSEFDEQALASVLNVLAAEDGDLAAAAGFSPDELVALLGANNEQTDPAEAPADFAEFGDDIETDHQCPKCGYVWSGSTAPQGAD
jgi:ParB-like chromosome segregation protein Spo0J